ncbi:MAG: ABC transporter permease subunit [Pseudomonadota bacterium]
MTMTAVSEGDQTAPETRDASVETFTQRNSGYYTAVFERHQRGQLGALHLNFAAFLVPWFWSAFRGVWIIFWAALAIDVIALVCLLQYVKYTPLLDAALSDPDNNRLLISRYSGWISTYLTFGTVILIAGHLWLGAMADRLYYRQYAKWRIDVTTPNGWDLRRCVLACMILVFCVPLTLYRATQQRLDDRACFNQLRAGESALQLQAKYGITDTDALIAAITAAQGEVTTERGRLTALDAPTDDQRAAMSRLRSEERSLGREADAVRDFAGITAKDRFDCAFIDDFPTLARIDPPEDVTYRRVTNDEGISELLVTVRPPVEGRKVNYFTYSAESIDISINYLRARFAGGFDAMTNALRQSLIRVEVMFMLTPWPVMAGLVLLISWAYAGRATTVFVAASLGFLAVYELWQIAMQTMALVIVSTAVCVIAGIPIGIWMAKNKVARWITEPILDVMQTIPSLSYLVPAVAFFGISQPPAVLATVIFAMPPIIKLTALGIRQVPESTKEAALAFGATEAQLLRKVELPMAVPSIMAGLNQTIMLALSMATISAFIGAEGLGAIVTSALGDAQAGKGLLAGIAIALVAMVIDRILKGVRESYSRV